MSSRQIAYSVRAIRSLVSTIVLLQLSLGGLVAHCRTAADASAPTMAHVGHTGAGEHSGRPHEGCDTGMDRTNDCFAMSGCSASPGVVPDAAADGTLSASREVVAASSMTRIDRAVAPESPPPRA